MNRLLYQNLLQIFKSSVARVIPQRILPERLKIVQNRLIIDDQTYNIDKNVYVVGFGKGVYEMMKAIEDILNGHIITGILSVPFGKLETLKLEERLKTDKVEVLEGAKNNLPDEDAERNTGKIMKLVEAVKAENLLIMLTTGGGSALLSSPIPPLTIREKRKTIELLSKSGADIQELNSVRKQLSKVKGGRLALMAAPAKVINLILSDVINDPLDVIASGPAIRNMDDSDIGLRIVKKYNLLTKIPHHALEILKHSRGSTDSKDFDQVNSYIIGNNTLAVEEAENEAENLGYKPVVMTKNLHGDARLVGECISKLIHKIKYNIQLEGQHRQVLECMGVSECAIQNLSESVRNQRNICLIFGGETVVKVNGTGVGGRNQELALSCALHHDKNYLKDGRNWAMISAGTDGIDGPTDSAGAIVDDNLIEDARKEGIENASKYLDDNDSYTFFSLFKNRDCLVKTGHTGTNVMDLIIVLIPFEK